jgi:organic radical activating enzyme
MAADRIQVYSIFHSFSGEVGVVPQGTQMLFVRLAGCNLRCSWCDTDYAQKKEDATKLMWPGRLLNTINEYKIHNILFTGGEPLLQKEALAEVIKALHDLGYHISVETNGSIFPDLFGVSGWIVDFKLPSSCMLEHMMKIEEFPKIIPTGARNPSGVVLKMVVGDILDFRYALMLSHLWQEHFGLGSPYSKTRIALSPGANAKGDPLPGGTLAKWILESKDRNIILNTQIHKLLKLKEDGESSEKVQKNRHAI